MCIKHLWWLITVPNINKIHWFISNISLQRYKIYDIMDINATFFTVSNVNKKQSNLFWDIVTNIKCMTNLCIITQIWHRATQLCSWLLYQICWQSFCYFHWGELHHWLILATCQLIHHGFFHANKSNLAL